MSVRHSIVLTLALAGALPALGVAANGPATSPAQSTALAAPGPIESLTVGAISSAAVDGCVLSYALQVTADAGGGTDTFRLEVWDDQVLVRQVNLGVPADGAVHAVSGTVDLPPVRQGIPGIGVYLVDATTLDVEDPLPATCVAFEIPAAGRAGIAGLGALILIAGFVALRRRAAPRA
jgi:hypothetical protein